MCLALGTAQAHLVTGSLQPQGGETFSRGSVMPIHWVVEQEHSGNYQISYSPSPGNWIVLMSGIRNNGGRFDQPMDTSWRIPDTLATTTTGRIRVWQSSPEPGNNAGSDTSNFYTLVSRNFTIQGGTPVLEFKARNRQTLRLRRQGDILFAMVPGMKLSRLFLLNPDGRMVAELTHQSRSAEGIVFTLPNGFSLQPFQVLHAMGRDGQSTALPVLGIPSF